MSSVPEDVYLEILLRVPEKSIYTCKSVCKAWFSLISNPNFMKLRRQRNTNLLMLRGRRGSNDLIYSITYDYLASSLTAVEIDYPYKSLGFVRYKNLVGSCNGLVCIWIRYWQFFCIWNPATKEYMKLPESPIALEGGDMYDDYNSLYAFGYDCKNDDYKIITVMEFSGLYNFSLYKYEESSLVYSYTLKSNSWRRCQVAPYMFRCSTQCNGVLVNGALHWVGRKRGDDESRFILSLDFNSEQFNEVPLTEVFFEKKDLSIGVLEECLCAIFDVGVGFQVWMMQEYGVKESWTNRYIISNDKIKNSDCYFRVLCSFQNSVILLLSGGNLVLYDTKDGSAREHNGNGVEYLYDKVNYFESLVSLDSGTYVGVDDEKEVEYELLSEG